MKESKISLFSILLGLVFLLGSFPVVCAQGSSEEEFTLEEIVVTAEKREADVQKTAMEITAVSGEDISTRAITDVTKVLDGLAAVSTMGGSQGNKIFIRGVGSSLDTDQASPSVTLEKDGVYMGQGEAVLSSTLFDIERIEVLYGPQGTLYGKNSAGGTVRIISKNPTDKFEAGANLTIGDYNTRNWNAVLNVPFSSKFAARLALDKQNHEAYLSNGSGTADRFATRTKFSYKPNDRLSLVLTSEWTWDKSKQMDTVPVPGSAGKLSPNEQWAVPDVNGDGVPDDFLDANGDETDDLDGDGFPDGNGIPDIVDTGWVLPYGADAWTTDEWHPAPRVDFRYQTNSLQLDWDMGWSKLTFIPTMNKNSRRVVNDFMMGIATGIGRFASGPMEGWEETQYTAEVRLASPADSKLIWTTGAYWNKNNNRQTNEQYEDLMDQAVDTWLNGSSGGPPPMSFTGVGGNLVAFQGPPPGGGPVAPLKSDNPMTQSIREAQDGYSLFGQATFPVTDRFRVTGGLRWNNEPSVSKYRIIIYNVAQDGVYGTDPTVSGYRYNLYDQTVEVVDATAPGGVRHLYDTGIAEYKVKKSPFIYTGGLEFDVADNSMLYATYKTGFKKGGLNTQNIVPPEPFDPEEVKAYTLGSKNRFMNNQLQLNLEAYYYDYTGMQVFCATSYWDELTQSTKNSMIIINAEKGKNFGLDVSTDWMFTALDKVSASASYMKTEYGAIVLPANPMAGSAEMDLTGTDLPNAPNWSGTLEYSHAFMLDSGASITPLVKTKISSGYWNTHEKYLPGSYTEGFRQSQFYITYVDAGQKYTVSLWGKNLENKAIAQYAYPRYRKFISEPRTMGITISAKF